MKPLPKRTKAEIRRLKEVKRLLRFQRNYHSQEFVLWVKQRGCCNCGSRMRIEAAHVKSRGAGGRAKENIVPLCQTCHLETGGRGFEEEAVRVWRLWEEGFTVGVAAGTLQSDGNKRG